MAGNPETRDIFLRTNILEYASKLDNAKRDELMRYQRDLQVGSEKTLQKLDGIQTKSKIVDEALENIKIDPNPKGKTSETSIRGNEFRKKVDEEVAAYQRTTGKEITNEELRKITNRLSTQVVLKPGILWDTKKSAFESNKGDIPLQDREEIERVIKSRGLPVTDDAVVKMYQKKVAPGGK
jgi:hypothetical protein